ncbi:hypothetical protein GCM10027037_27140 [Mucilaginibacter koreensis]
MQSYTDTSKTLDPDEVTVKALVLKTGRGVKYVRSKWWVILMAVIIGGALGIAYAFYKKPVYTSECTFVMDDGSNRGGGALGSYAALASAFGFDVGGSSGSLFQGDNITQLYQSRLMVESTLLSKANFNGKPELLVDRYLDMKKMRKGWENNPKLKNLRFDIPKEQFTRQHDSIITNIVNDINKNLLTVSKVDKKLSLVSVKVKAPDELFAKAFTESIVNTVNAFYIQTKTKGSMQAVNLLQHQADSLRRVLNASLSGTAAAADYNPNPNPALQVLRVPVQRKQIDVQTSSAIYAEVVKNLTIARSSLQTATPIVQIIDSPVLPLAKEGVGKLKAALTGMLIGAMLSIIMLVVYKLYKNLMS